MLGIQGFIILLILFSLMAVYVDRRVEVAPATSRTQTPPPSSTGVNDAKPAWHQRWRRQKPLSRAQRFRTWCQQAFADHPDVQGWLNRLNDDRFAAFTNEVTAFCLAFGVELEWLVNQELQQFPALKQELLQALAYYSRAHQTVTAVQDQVVAWKAYRDFDQNPYGKETQSFVQALFAKLVEQQLTPAMPAELAGKAETDRQIYLAQIIRQTAAQQPERFQQALLAAVLMINSAQIASLTTGKKGWW